jgi:hypothetical protein
MTRRKSLYTFSTEAVFKYFWSMLGWIRGCGTYGYRGLTVPSMWVVRELQNILTLSLFSRRDRDSCDREGTMGLDPDVVCESNLDHCLNVTGGCRLGVTWEVLWKQRGKVPSERGLPGEYEISWGSANSFVANSRSIFGGISPSHRSEHPSLVAIVTA